MGAVEPDFMETRQAEAWLGLSHRALEGYRVSGGGPDFHQFGNRVRYPPLGSGRLGAAAPCHHDGAGGPTEGGVTG